LDLYRTKKAIAAVPVLKRFPRNKEGTLSAAGMPRNVSVNHPDAQHVGDIQSLSPKRTIRRRIWATMEAAMRKNLKLASVFVAAILITGCGNTNENCQLTALSVSPQGAAADHTVAAPDNQVQFFAGAVIPKGCVSVACVNCSDRLGPSQRFDQQQCQR
jgi:hypothetical protein